MRADLRFILNNDLRSIQRVVNLVAERCRELGFSRKRLRFNFRVGVSEALANAMLYGNGRDPNKKVRLEAQLEPGTVTIRVTDEGHGFDPERLPDPRSPANLTRPGGRGIFLIRELMDQVEFNERGNSITMVLLDDSRDGNGV